MLIKHNNPTNLEVEVKFVVPAAVDAKTVTLVGDFNSWSKNSHPMIFTSDLRWEVSLVLPPNHKFGFLYWIDGRRWQNDWDADDYDTGDPLMDISVVMTKLGTTFPNTQ